MRFAKTIDFGKDPDNMRFDEGSKRCTFGFGEDDGGIAMIDPKLMNESVTCTKLKATPSHSRSKPPADTFRERPGCRECG